jgi:hypothetical protein
MPQNEMRREKSGVRAKSLQFRHARAAFGAALGLSLQLRKIGAGREHRAYLCRGDIETIAHCGSLVEAAARRSRYRRG